MYIEGQGFHCLLCKKHQTTNTQNKESKSTVEPPVRIKKQTLKSHLDCSAHQRAVSGELLNRMSYFQHQLDHAAEVADEVYFNAFYAMYWLTKHCIANKQVNSLITLLEHLGCEVKSFQHRYAGLERDYSAYCQSDPRRNCRSSQIICYLWYPHGRHDRRDK